MEDTNYGAGESVSVDFDTISEGAVVSTQTDRKQGITDLLKANRLTVLCLMIALLRTI